MDFSGLRSLQDASKTPPRRLQIFIIFWMPFWIDFGSVFPPNLEPKIQENRSKIDAEMASHVDLIFGSIFPRFLLPTWTLRTSFGASGLAPNGFFRIFRKPHIGCDFGANLAPFSFPKSMKIHPKIDPKMDQFCDRFGDGFFYGFGIDFEGQLGAMLASKIDQKLSQTPPGRPQDALRSYCFDFSAS